jgi:hypothetical protein
MPDALDSRICSYQSLYGFHIDIIVNQETAFGIPKAVRNDPSI